MPSTAPPRSNHSRAVGAKPSGHARRLEAEPQPQRPLQGRTPTGQPQLRATIGVGSRREAPRRRDRRDLGLVRLAVEGCPQRAERLVESGTAPGVVESTELELASQKPGVATRTKLPAVSWSSVEACLTNHWTSRSGSTVAPSPTRTPGWRPARKASQVNGSIPPAQSGNASTSRSPSPSQNVETPAPRALAAANEPSRVGRTVTVRIS